MSSIIYNGHEIQDLIFNGNQAQLWLNGEKLYPSAPVDPYNPLNLPPLTVRTKWVSGYTPTLGTTNTLVDASENIWDIYISNTSWSSKFSSSSVRGNILEIIGANTSDVTSMSRTFQQCSNLTSVCNMDIRNATTATGMFNGCTSLASVGDMRLDSATDLKTMFRNCTSLIASPNIVGTSSVTTTEGMFSGCSSLTTVTVFDTSSVTSMGTGGNVGGMFQDCTSLTSIPLFNTSSCGMFLFFASGCTSLTSVPLLDTSSCTSMSCMFYGCTNVQSGALALYQQASTQTTPPGYYSDAFTNCGSNTQTGYAELLQIPDSWGGLMVPLPDDEPVIE